jgi:hypothetical protein
MIQDDLHYCRPYCSSSDTRLREELEEPFGVHHAYPKSAAISSRLLIKLPVAPEA